MNIKVFTHTDLDGIGSGLLLKSLFPNDNVDIVEMNYHEIKEIITEFHRSKSYQKYDKIFMVDLSIPESENNLVIELDKMYGDKFILLDHHASAMWLNKYKWSNVISEYKGKKTSGTSLVIEYGLQSGYLNKIEPSLKQRMEEFAELVRSYDTWEWSETNNIKANQLNTIFFKTPITSFKKRMLESNYNLTFTDKDKEILRKDEQELKDAVDSVLSQLVEVPVYYNNSEYVFGVAVEERKVSEVGNIVSSLKPDLFGIILLNKDLVKGSFRTVNNVRMDSLVKDLYGGGGHPKACGAMFTNENGKEFINTYLRIKKNKNNVNKSQDLKYVFQSVKSIDNYDLKMARLKKFIESSEFYRKENIKYNVSLDKGLLLQINKLPKYRIGITFNGLYILDSKNVHVEYKRASEDTQEIYYKKLIQYMHSKGILEKEYTANILKPLYQAYYLKNKLPTK